MSPRLPVATAPVVIRVLERNGWQLERVQGSHHKFWHPDFPNSVVVPKHRKDLKSGTLHRILTDAGISRDEFQRLR